MTTIKTLTLAAVTALSLSAGAAMAQSESPSVNQYLPAAPASATQRGPAAANALNQFPQSGSSDVNTTHPGTALFPEWKYGDLPG